MATDATGNVLQTPGLGSKPIIDNTEILYSYAKFTQKGVTLLQTANTYYPTGTVLKVSATPKKYTAAIKGASEVQTLNLGAATAGTITITFAGQTTGAIAFNASAATVQTALIALSNVNPGDVVVTGGPLPGTITLTFGGQYANTNVAQITVTPTGLTGGTVTVNTTTGGSGDTSPVGILRKGVDVSLSDKSGNIVLSGILKGNTIRYADDTDGLSTAELQALATELGGHYDVIHDALSF
jgi:hypothetical protein